uniref:Syntaxin n=1 Tax=Solanum tuberosum TaxID=4113 RepID=M1BXT1_SOLTU
MNDLLNDGVDTFEAPRHQNDRNEDIEMGIQRPMDSGELGLDDFFKQVQQIEKQYEKLEKLLKKLQHVVSGIEFPLKIPLKFVRFS